MEFSFKVTGLTETVRALEQLGPEIATKAGRQAALAGARVIAAEAKRRAPVGETFRIRLSSGRKPKFVGHLKDEVKAASRRPETGKVTATIGVGRAYWGMFLEFGTRFMRARPWLRPAAESASQAAIDRMGVILTRAVDRETKRLRGKP